MNMQQPNPPRRSDTRDALLYHRALAEYRKRQRRKRWTIFWGCLLIVLLTLGILWLFLRERAISSGTTDTTENPSIADTPPVTTEENAADTDVPDDTEPETNTVIRPSCPVTAITPRTQTIDTEMFRSEYGFLLSLSDYTVTAQLNGMKRVFPASITKVMTLIVAYEQATNLDDTFTMTSKLIDPVYLAGASMAGFQPNEVVTVRDLMYGTILPSGGEAAVGLAVYTAGSENAFVELMNQKAKEMGLTDTSFTNCTGLHHDNHYSTCEDLARILAYALQYEECRTILSTYKYTTAPTNVHPDGIELTSTMFSRMYGDEPEGVTVIAGKTGYTPEAGQCLVSFATRDSDGAGYVFVSVKGSDRFDPIFDAIDVYSRYVPPVVTEE